MNRSLVKNLLMTSLCLLILMPGVILLHTVLPAQISTHIHSGGFNGQLHIFWDARPYAQGISAYNSGHNPYPLDDPQNMLPFAYPPAFLWAGNALARLVKPEWGWNLYIAINVASVLLLLLVLSAVFLRRLAAQESLALLAFAPLCMFLTTVFWSGNIHLVWYFAALLAAFPGLRGNRWLGFYAVVLLAAVNQPVFVVMLLLPFLAGTRQLLFCIVDTVLIAAAYVAEKMFNPSLYRQFQATIAQHLQASRDFGEGLFGMVATLLDGRTHLALQIAFAVQILFSASLFFLLLFLRTRVQGDPVRWWGLIVIAIALVNPRVMPYDAAIGLVPACYFLVAGIRFRLDSKQTGRWLLIGGTVICTLVAHRLFGFTVLLFAGFALGSWQLAAGKLDLPLETGDAADGRGAVVASVGA